MSNPSKTKAADLMAPSWQERLDQQSGLGRRSRTMRFNLAVRLEVLARPFGMRSYNFWLEAVNVSLTGFLLRSTRPGLVPFHIGTRVQGTVDLGSKLFRRPLHFLWETRRADNHDKVQFFGMKILKVEPDHAALFEEGLRKLGDPHKQES